LLEVDQVQALGQLLLQGVGCRVQG
jgi:hypothetical protein